MRKGLRARAVPKPDAGQTQTTGNLPENAHVLYGEEGPLGIPGETEVQEYRPAFDVSPLADGQLASLDSDPEKMPEASRTGTRALGGITHAAPSSVWGRASAAPRCLVSWGPPES